MRSSHIALGLVSTLVSTADAHTLFSRLFINGASQGDGSCLRLPKNPDTATNPIRDLGGNDMVCGFDGLNPAAFTCPAPAGSRLTFEFREYPDAAEPGAIDNSHKGPCAVYLKKVSNMENDPAQGSGWFKFWDMGYDETAKQWCTEKLIANKGLLSVDLPATLPAGYYLVRPELLALHEAQVGDPQFYHGCAQIFIKEGPAADLQIPDKYKCSIPGHVKQGEPAVTFNVYNNKGTKYTMPGPPVYAPPAPSVAGSAGSASGAKAALAAAAPMVKVQDDGIIPADCLIKNGNWCGVEVASYSGEAACYRAAEDCYDQQGACYDSSGPTGSPNCEVWGRKCDAIQATCRSGKSASGPPNKGQKLKAEEPPAPGPIPSMITGPGADVAVVGSSPASSSSGSSTSSGSGGGGGGSGGQSTGGYGGSSPGSTGSGSVSVSPGGSGSTISGSGSAGSGSGSSPSGSTSPSAVQGNPKPTRSSTPAKGVKGCKARPHRRSTASGNKRRRV